MRILRSLLCALALAGAVSMSVSSCKQADGKRCQLDSDCECGQCIIVSGLEGLCCEGSGLTDGGPTVDANMSIDSATPDASSGDASTD